MKFTYENTGSCTYLVYELAPEDVIDEVSLGMMRNNEIEGLAPALFTQRDERRFLKYRVSSMMTPEQLFSGAASRKQVIGALKGAARAFLSAEEYMIDASGLVLDPRYLFADARVEKTAMICLPLKGLPPVTSREMIGFFREIVFSPRYDRGEDTSYVTELMNMLNARERFSPEGFYELLRRLERETRSRAASPVKSERDPEVWRDAAKPGSRQAQGESQAESSERLMERGAREFGAPGIAVPALGIAAPPLAQAAPSPTQVPPSPTQAPPPPAKTASPTAKPAAKPPKTPARGTAKPKGASASREKPEEITLFWLLSHYSKENLEKYKAHRSSAESGTGEKRPKKARAEKSGSSKEKKPKRKYSRGTRASVTDAMGAAETPESAREPAPGREAYSAASPSSAFDGLAFPEESVRAESIEEGSVVISAGRGGLRHDAGGAVFAGTVLLAEKPAIGNAELFRRRTGETVGVTGPVFRIGTDPGSAEYCVAENAAISRSHAAILERDGEFYLSDLRSTNGSYANGRRLEAGEEAYLGEYSEIRLADEAFTFRKR